LPTNTPPRIAIPMPHSIDREYAERAITQYERAVEQAGGDPVRIALDQTAAEVMKLEVLKIEVLKIMERCDGVLLPGSKADVDPSKFGVHRSPHTADADPCRDAVDRVLLQDAYALRKPVLGICYGLQSLNVYRGGSLVQHIPDFLPEDFRTRIKHEAGRTVAVAHTAEIEEDSELAEIVSGKNRKGHSFSSQPALSKRSAPKDADKASGRNGALAPQEDKLVIPVNSSHHQSAEVIGDGLRIAARCPEDGIIEALEGTNPEHFVLAVQWHPERSVNEDEPSRAIFRALVKAAERRNK
jgi:putative glutamine amidotransferase